MTFRLPDKRYGREAEAWTLIRAFERSAAGPCEIVMVSGWAGAGKSTLVEELQPSIAARKGYLVSGKFDQYNRSVPFATLLRALDDLAQRVLGDGEGDESSEWQERLYDALGEGAALLVETIPSARAMIGTAASTPQAPVESQARLEHALLRFLSVFARPNAPLVLFLDDLQWADAASLRFFVAVGSDPNIRNTLLIGTYRDQEVGPDHPVMASKLALLQRGARIEDIVLPPLSPKHLESLLQDTFGETDVHALAGEVHRRTRGNPFFTREFVRLLVQEGLVTSSPSGGFSWDIAQIRSAPLPADAVDLVLREMRKLSDETQSVLRVAACMGTQFDVREVASVLDQGTEQVLWALEIANNKEFVLPDTSAAVAVVASNTEPIPFRFFHDHVRQAAYELIGEEELPKIRLKVGRRLHSDAIQRGNVEEKLFEIVEHLNAGSSLMSDSEERKTLALLDLSAGKRAKQRTAYDAAARYFGSGASLVAAEAERDLVFSLELGRAECDLLRGQLDEADARLEAFSVRPQSSLEKSALCRVRMAVQTTRGRATEAIDIGLQTLIDLGLDIPMDEPSARIKAEEVHARVRALIGERNLSALADGAPLTDPDKRAMLEILTNLLAPANLVRPALFSLCSGIQANISIEYGHADESIYGYMLYGMHLATTLGRYSEAGGFGRLALALDEKRGSAGEPCRLNFVYGSYAHFLEPLPDVLGYLRKAYQTGLALGDYIYLSYACSHIVLLRIALGHPLDAVDEETERFLALMERTKVASSIAVQTLARRMIAALAGRTESLRSLNGDGFDEDSFVASLRERSVHFALSWYRAIRIKMAFINGDYQDAIAAAGDVNALASGTLFYFATDAIFFVGLAAGYLCPEGADPSSQHAGILEKFRAIISTWASACPENFKYKHLMLSGEQARIHGDIGGATQLYNQAIARASGAGLSWYVAIASERAGQLYRLQDQEQLARAQINQAITAYESWGAFAAAARLRKAYADLLLPDIIARVQKRAFSRTLELGIFALGAVVTDAVILARPALECTRDAFVIDVVEEMGLMENDEEKLRWILLRLLGERAKKKRPGVVKLHVTPERISGEEDFARVLLEITDTDALGDENAVDDVAEVCQRLGGDLIFRRDFGGVRCIVAIPMVY